MPQGTGTRRLGKFIGRISRFNAGPAFLAAAARSKANKDQPARGTPSAGGGTPTDDDWWKTYKCKCGIIGLRKLRKRTARKKKPTGTGAGARVGLEAEWQVL